MKPDDEFNKVFDLEESEYGPADRSQPFLGVNGKHFLILFAASFPLAAIASLIVYGQLPYWLQWLLE